MRQINTIFVHCTATRADFMAGATGPERVAEIKRWHVNGNGWRDIGYHFLIDRDGTGYAGRPINQTGAHARGHNTGSVAIALFGGHGSSENDGFFDNFTPEQDAALRAKIAELRAAYPIERVRGHNEVAAKACPGFNVTAWLESEPWQEPQPRSPWAAFFGALAGWFGGKNAG